MATYNGIIKNRNSLNNGWDSFLPITTSDNVLIDSENNLTEELNKINDDVNKVDKKIPYVNVMSYGAKGDGITDDTVAFQTAINTGGEVFVPYTSTGYLINGSLNLPPNSKIVGEKQPILYGKSANLFIVKGNFVEVDNFNIDFRYSVVENTAIYIDTSENPINYVTIKNLRFDQCHHGIKDYDSNFVAYLTVTDCVSFNPKGTQHDIQHSRGFIRYTRVNVENVYNTAPVTWASFRFQDFNGIELETVDVVGPTKQTQTPTYQPTQFGIVFVGNLSTNAYTAVWMNNVRCDTSMGKGIWIQNVTDIWVNNLNCGYNLGTAITMENVHYGTFSNTWVYGSVGVDGNIPDCDGIVMTNCTELSFNNVILFNNTGHGLLLSNSKKCQFTNLQSFDNSKWGIYELGTTDEIVIMNARITGNVSGSITQVGENSSIVSWIDGYKFRYGDVGAKAINVDTPITPFYPKVRVFGGTPIGEIEPAFIGEEVLDNVNNIWYKSYGLANSDWKPITATE